MSAAERALRFTEALLNACTLRDQISNLTLWLGSQRHMKK